MRDSWGRDELENETEKRGGSTGTKGRVKRENEGGGVGFPLERQMKGGDEGAAEDDSSI